MENVSEIITGLYIPAQITLDPKAYCLSESVLSSLGNSSALAFTYFDGLTVKCQLEKTIWEWREVKIGEENTGLVPNDFVYPINIIVAGIDYSGKKYNFFIESRKGDKGEKGETGATGAQGAQGVQGVQGIQGLKGDQGLKGTDGKTLLNGIIPPLPANGTEGDFYLNTATSVLYGPKIGNAWGSGISLVGPQGPQGLQGLQGPQGIQGVKGDNVETNLRKKIDSSYTLSNLDNDHTIVIKNGTTDVNITVPAGLLKNFSVGLLKTGTGKVKFVAIGTVLNTAEANTFVMKGIRLPVYLEQDGISNNFDLLGNLIP